MKYNIHDINGVKTIFMDMAEANSVTVQVFVNAGSVYESETNNGISHFLEHMFFKGGIKYQNSHDVAVVVDSFGGEFNAYTGLDVASYYVKSAPDYIYQSMDVLSDMLVHAAFPEIELETEKGVVMQEMKMYEDNPRSLMRQHASKRYFGKNSYGRPIIGNPQTVNAITRQNLLDRKNNLYNKNNLILVIVGRLPNEEELKAKVSEYFSDIPDGQKYEKPMFDVADMPKEKISFFDKGTQQNHLIMRCDGPYRDIYDFSRQREFCAAKLAMIAFGGNMSSRLFQEIREKTGVCYYINSGCIDSIIDKKGIGAFYISAGLDKDKRTQALSDIYEQVDILAEKGITQEEFIKAKGYELGGLQMGIETTDQRTELLGQDYLQYGQMFSIEYMYKLYDSLTLEEVNNSIKNFKRENIYLYYIK